MRKYKAPEVFETVSEETIRYIEECVAKGDSFYILDEPAWKHVVDNVVKGYKAGRRDRLMEMGGIALLGYGAYILYKKYKEKKA